MSCVAKLKLRKNPMLFIVICLLLSIVCTQYGHTFKNPGWTNTLRRGCDTSLKMGRAAAVRAATKTRQDGAKSNNNRKYARRILAAIKSGGNADPSLNVALSMVIADARAKSVPKDVIQRNIDKSKEGITEDYKEQLFEFFGPGGCGFLVNVLTDNINRARNALNIAAKKHLLKPANSNAVGCKFELKSRLDIPILLEEDQLVELCIEIGIDDYQLHSKISDCPLSPQTAGHCSIYVDRKDMVALRDALSRMGIESIVSLQHVPATFVALNDADFEAAMSAISALEDEEDVDSVDHNIDMSSE